MFRLIIAVILSVLPNTVKCCGYRLLMSARIGKDARIGFGTVILADRISVGERSCVGRFNRIRATVFELGNSVTIGDFNKITVHTFSADNRSAVSSQVDVRGDSADPRSVFSMGMHSWVFDYCYINVVRPVVLGRNVGVGGGSYLFTHGLWLSQLDGFPVSYGPINIADNSWLPWGCFVMPNVEIGHDVIVGARSVVTKSVPSHALVAGIPAKIIRERSNRDVSTDEKLLMLTELTDAFGASRKAPIVWMHGHALSTASMNGLPLLTLHRTIDATEIGGGLNVILGNRPHEAITESVAWFSIANYSCSPCGRMPETAQEWLTFGRTIGLRFYPVDELSVLGGQN